MEVLNRSLVKTTCFNLWFPSSKKQTKLSHIKYKPQNGVIKPDPYLVAMSENVVLHTKGSGLSGMNTKITKWQYRNHYNGTVQW